MCEITIRGDIDHLVAYKEFDELKQFLNVTEKYLAKAKSEFETKSFTELGLDSLPNDIRNDIYNDKHWYYDVKFPRILRNSFLVTAISYLEYEIYVIYSRLKKIELIPSKDSTDKGYEQAKLVWKLVDLESYHRSKIWQELKFYYKVRNCIVHKDGLIMELEYKDRRVLIPYLKKTGIISHDTIDEEIALTASFCEEVITTIQHFLNYMYENKSFAMKNLESSNRLKTV